MGTFYNMPKDYWRFTPDALCLMAEDCRAVVLECGGWGNKDVWRYMELGFRMAPVPGDFNHPICHMAMKNEETLPIVTWKPSHS